MRPGPTIIRSCSHCSGLIAQSTLGSRSSRGPYSDERPDLWTDLKPRDEPYTVYKTGQVCPHCRGWIDPWALKEVGSVPSWDKYWDVYPGADAPEFPSVEELVALVATGLTPRQEWDLRRRAWWTGNDRRRNSSDPFELPFVQRRRSDPPHVPEVDLETGELVPSSWPPPGASEKSLALDPPPPLTAAEIANAEVLLVSTSGGHFTEDLVVRAEIMRLFGRFEEARAFAVQLPHDEPAPFRRFLLQLIAIRDLYVREFREP